MKRLHALVLVSAVLPLLAAPILGQTAPVKRMSIARVESARTGVAHKSTSALCNGICYSAEVAVVTRVQGTAFFRTSIDISNNTTQPITATFQYTYVFNNQVFHTAAQTIQLAAVDNFHQDDIVQYLGVLGLLQPGADQSSFGTFLVTFDNLPSKVGWEGTITARTYSPDPTGIGTNGIAYPGTLFFESANQTLVGTIHDTRPAPTIAGALRTNLGVRNTDLNSLGDANPVTVQVSFFDVTEGSATNGQQVGQTLQIAGLLPGEVHQINDVFTTAQIPANVTACIVFVDVIAPTTGFPTVEGYINILDDDTKDGSYFEMKCTDTDGCAN
ncbi:MAG TPA: hypothetical protein VGL03_05955 [Thermoanaerobaculia bacterium]|jgi:hypothetical protein